MKKLIGALLLLASTGIAAAQVTTVTATVVDSDSTPWANGTFTAFYAPVPSSPGPLTNSSTGQVLIANPVSGTLNSSGAFSIGLPQTKYIFGPNQIQGNSPGVIFSVCPQVAPTTCYTTGPIKITGSTQSVSAQINAVIVAPRITGLIKSAQAYNDAEVAAVEGNQYTRLSDGTRRCYSTGAWGACGGGGGGGTVSSPGLTTGVYPVSTGAQAIADGTIGVLPSADPLAITMSIPASATDGIVINAATDYGAPIDANVQIVSGANLFIGTDPTPVTTATDLIIIQTSTNASSGLTIANAGGAELTIANAGGGGLTIANAGGGGTTIEDQGATGLGLIADSGEIYEQFSSTFGINYSSGGTSLGNVVDYGLTLPDFVVIQGPVGVNTAGVIIEGNGSSGIGINTTTALGGVDGPIVIESGVGVTIEGDVTGGGTAVNITTPATGTANIEIHNATNGNTNIQNDGGKLNILAPVTMTGITGHGTKGPVCVDASGNLYVGNNSGVGAPCP